MENNKSELSSRRDEVRNGSPCSIAIKDPCYLVPQKSKAFGRKRNVRLFVFHSELRYFKLDSVLQEMGFHGMAGMQGVNYSTNFTLTQLVVHSRSSLK